MCHTVNETRPEFNVALLARLGMHNQDVTVKAVIPSVEYSFPLPLLFICNVHYDRDVFAGIMPGNSLSGNHDMVSGACMPQVEVFANFVIDSHTTHSVSLRIL